MNQRGIIAPIWLYLIAGIAVLAMIGGIIFWADRNIATTAGVKKGEAAKQLEWDRAVAKQRAAEEKRIGEASERKEQADVKAKVVYRTITQTVDRYIDRPIYRNVCLDPDGLRDANNALLGTLATADKPDGSLPPADGTK